MKNHAFKKAVALFLTVITIFSACSALLASAKQSVTPVIVISGMASFPLYLDAETEEEKQVFAPLTADILNALKQCIVPLGKTAVNRDWSYLVDGAMTPAYELFDYVACNADGTSKYNVSTRTFPKSVANYSEVFLEGEKTDDEIGLARSVSNAIGAENTYYFNYDWRLDPLEHADALNEFIDSVLAETGSAKVNLIPASMGGCVIMSYLYKYGAHKINNLVMAETAFLGADIAGETFNKRLAFSTDTLLEYFYTFYQNEGFLYQILFGLLSSAVDLSLIDVEKTLDALIASLLSSMTEELYNKVLSTVFGTMPGIWALVPNASYESAKLAMFPDGMNAVLEQRLDTYQNDVQLNAKRLLDEAVSDGVKLSFIASYGFIGFPAVNTATDQSDCLVETHYESGNATCAGYGETLGADYKALGTVCADETHRHVSTDGIIDASTCMYPEQVWFIKGNRHVGLACGTQAADLAVWLATNEQAVDVYSDSRYPQFTKLELFSGKLTSLTGDTIKISMLDGHSGLLTRIIVFIKGIFAYLISVFAKA